MRQAIARTIAVLVPSAASLGAQSAEPALHARLFGDFNYVDTQRPLAEGFRLGQVAGHLTWGMSDRVTFFSEATVSAQALAEAIEIERVFIRYDYRDWLQLSGGRVHAPMSYWNTTFHHGQWMQTSIGRPEMIRGGNALIPIHFVGVVAEGRLPAGPASFGYTAGLGNGRGVVLTRAGDAGDANNSRARFLATSLRVPVLAGVEVGGTYYADRLTPSAAFDVRERILSGHVALEGESPELIVEYARVRHDPVRPLGLPTATSAAWYGQLGVRLRGRARDWKPYVRWDDSRVPATDTILAPMRLNFSALTGGVRLDVGSSAAMKMEYRAERVERGARMRTLAASVSFTFPGKSAHHEEPVLTDDAAHDHASATPDRD